MSSGLIRRRASSFEMSFSLAMSTAMRKAGGRSAFASARLEHVESAVLDGELHVLHVAIMLLKSYSNFLELGINLGHGLGHFAQRHGCANAGDDIFSLGVDEVIAVKDFSPYSGRA